MPARPPLPRRLRLELFILVSLATGATAVALIGGEPYEWWNAAAMIVAWLAFLVLTQRPHRLLWLAPITIVGVVIAQFDPDMEVGIFLLSVLALWVASSGPLTWQRILVLAAAIVAPVVINLVNPEVIVPIWAMGIVFPALMGWSEQNQRRLAEELAGARLALAERAVVEERRQIARDVHDLVGHGLAAAMVQVTSARHVLRRDPDAADEALEIAERVGRSSMQELRQTVGSLRGEDTPVTALPGGAEIGVLIDTARATGQQITSALIGELPRVDGVRGLTLYRVCQEALVNAARHAPGAAVTVSVEVDEAGSAHLTVDNGPATSQPPDDTERGRFGIRGMTERAAVVGGELSAGPHGDGWRVELTLPAPEEIR